MNGSSLLAFVNVVNGFFQGDMGAKQGEFQGEEIGCTREANEKVQASPGVVVLVHTCYQHWSNNLCL